MRVCREGGGVRSLKVQLPACSSAMHEVSHDLLFTATLIRPGGEASEVVLSDVGDGGSTCRAGRRERF